MVSVGSITRSTLRVHLMILSCAIIVGAEVVQIVTPENTRNVTEEPKTTTPAPGDSYLKAYQEAQKLRSAPVKRNDYSDPPEKEIQGSYNTVIRSSHLPSDKYPSLTPEWTPMHAVSSPPTSYGPPQMSYGPPQVSYAPPQVSYGPSHAHHYHHEVLPPRTHSCHPTPYSAPSNYYLGFLPKKLSLKILLKILLKLVLFKMIVKFIAVICLLLFIPLLKSQATTTTTHMDEDRRAREIDTMSDLIWNSIDSKNSLYGDDEEMKDIKEIAEEMDGDDDEENNVFAKPTKAVRFLEFCISTVDRVVGFLLGVIQRQSQAKEGEDLGSFVLERISEFFKKF